jgi:hypothetical protein
MNSLHLLLALPARPDQIVEHARQAAPSLIKLLRRGRPAGDDARYDAAHDVSLAGTLCRACGIKQQQDWPLAPICAAADGLNVDPQDYWLRLDPVHLEVVMGGLILRPPTSLQLGMPEAESLIADINLHWQADGLKIEAASATRWYLRLAETPNLRTTPLDQMAGEYLTPHLPRGADARQFIQRINEVQMLLHSHPVNLARENEGRPAVNGLWLWGGGTLPAVKTRFDLIAADVFELAALARPAGLTCLPQPEALSELRDCQRALVVLSQPEGDWDGDLAARLAQLERNWLQPVLRQLKQGRLRRLRLDLAGSRAVTLTPLQAWRFWR